MSNVKNYGLSGVSSDVQFGKGGARLVQISGTFAAKNAQGNAFARLQVADGSELEDAVTVSQLSNAIANVTSSTSGLQTEIDAIETGAGLNSDGTYTSPVSSNFMNGALSLKNATELLDSALKTESNARIAADSTLTSDLANTNADVAAVVSDLSNTDANVSAIDGRVTALEANVSSEADRLDALESNVTTLQGDVAGLASDISDEANARVSGDAVNAGLISDEANARIAADAVNAGLISDEANARVAGDAVNAGLVSDEANARAAADSLINSNVAAVASDLANTNLIVSGITGSISDEANARAAADELINANVAAVAQSVSDEANARVSGDAVNAGLVSDEANARIAADAVNAGLISAETNARVAADAVNAGLISDEANARVAGDAVNAGLVSDEANARSAADSLINANVTAVSDAFDALEANAVLKDGSVAFTGDLNMANHLIANVATPNVATDAANKGYVDTQVAALGNAFKYKGTVDAEGGINADSDAQFDAGREAGDYYKIVVAGDITSGADTIFFNVNDGLVWNIAGGIDKIDNTDSVVLGTAGQIGVSGSTDTGYTVSIDGAYTAARQQEVADEANARVSADNTLSNAIASEANTRSLADTMLNGLISDLTADLANTDANVSAIDGRVTALEANVSSESGRLDALESNVAALQGDVAGLAGDISDEANARVAGDAVNAGLISDEANARAAADSLINSNVAAVASDLANTNLVVDGITSSISDETNARVAADALINSNVAAVAQSVSDEANARVSGDAVNAGLISDEANARVAGDAVNAGLVSDEANARSAADSLINSNVAAVASDLANTNLVVDGITSSISDETNARVAADSLINANVAAVASDLANAQSEINTIETAAGLNTDGTYSAPVGSFYLANATSLADADTLLDAELSVLSNTIANLQQDEIVSIDSFTSVKAANTGVQFNGNVDGTKTLVGEVLVGANTNTEFKLDLNTAGEVALMAASNAVADVNLRLTGQGAGHVIIGETGVGYIQADDGYDMTVAGGVGANLNLYGDNVIVGSDDGTPVVSFAGTNGAAANMTVTNGATAVTFTAGGATNTDLVFAPSGSGSVSVSGAKIVSVANATASTDAVNLGQMTSAIAAAAVGSVQTVVASLTEVDGTVTIGSVKGTVISVRVLVTGAFGTGTTITVGSASGTATELATSSDIDESSAALYIIETAKQYASASNITATISNSTLDGTGSAKVIVEYIVE